MLLSYNYNKVPSPNPNEIVIAPVKLRKELQHTQKLVLNAELNINPYIQHAQNLKIRGWTISNRDLLSYVIRIVSDRGGYLIRSNPEYGAYLFKTPKSEAEKIHKLLAVIGFIEHRDLEMNYKMALLYDPFLYKLAPDYIRIPYDTLEYTLGELDPSYSNANEPDSDGTSSNLSAQQSQELSQPSPPTSGKIIDYSTFNYLQTTAPYNQIIDRWVAEILFSVDKNK